jgi:ankyrin repeat protein
LSRLLYRTVALAAALLAAARTVNAETVALGSFAHVDLERNDPDTGASIATLLQAALGETPGRTFVERQEAQKLMDELGLAALGESDPESASRIGKLLRADVMLTGTFVTPEGGKPFIVLETTELARAEPLGQARVELDRVLERGRLAVPGRDDMAKIAAAAGALLDESRDRLAASRGLVSIKFLGFTHNLRDPRVGSFEAQLAAAIDSAAAASGTHRVLSLERADVATQESEFVLLGLAEADAKAYAQVADYFVWGSAEGGAQMPPQFAQAHPAGAVAGPAPMLSIKVWDGRHPPVEFREPLDPAAPRDSAARLAAKAIAAAVPVKGDATSAPAFGKGIAHIFVEHERAREGEARDSDPPGVAAARRLEEERLLSAAVFFYPASSDAWFRLQRLRMPPLVTAGRVSDIKREVQSVQFTLEVAKRFLVAANGRIDPTPLDEFFGPESLMYEDRFVRLKDQVAMIEEDFHDIYLSHNLDAVIERLSADYRTGVMQLCRELARAAPGQEDAYRRTASALLFTILENDFPKGERIAAVSSLAPRLKVALLVHRAWYPTGDRLEALEPPLRSELIDEGRQADADSFDTLSPDELAQAERSEPAEGSPAADKLGLAAMEARTLANFRARPASAGMAAPIQASLDRLAASKAEAERLRRPAMLFLESHAAGWTWTPAMNEALLAGPPNEQMTLFYPPLESLPAPQRAQAVAWLRQEAGTVGSQGYSPEIAEALKAKADALEAAPEPTPVPGPPVHRSGAFPRYMDPKSGSFLVGDYAWKGDVASINALFKEGVPVAYAAGGFFEAVRGEEWPAAYFILGSGFDPAAPWPQKYYASISDTFSPDTAARLALAAAIGAGRQDLTDLLLGKGVRFGADGAAAGRLIHTLALRRDIGPLRQVLAAGGRAGGVIVQGEKQPLYYAVHYRDPALLDVLLDLGCNALNAIEMTMFSKMKEANSRQWIAQDPNLNSAIGLAAKTNWLEGSRIILDKDWKDVGGILSDVRLDRYATDPAVRSLFVHAELTHLPIRSSAGDAGIALFTAIAARDSPAFESALAAPGALLFRAFMGESALMFAIEEGEPAFAGRLIDAGAPVDAADYKGATPLCYAARADDAEIVEALVRHGASPDGGAGSAPTPLEEAIAVHDPKLALRLVELGASLAPRPSRAGFNPLFRAVWEDMPDLATKLMSLGADPLRTAQGYTIMFSAARSDDPDLIQLLCAKGCDPNRRAPNGWTPLTTAVRWGAADSVRKLLELGVRDPHAAAVSVSMVNDITPPDRPPMAELRRATHAPDYQRCVELMEEFGQLDQSQEARDSIFWHRSHTVAEIEAYLSGGGNVNAIGSISPLQSVLTGLDSAKVQALLAHGADPNLAGPEDPPPLVMALGSPDIVRLLLDHGANPNQASTLWQGRPLWNAVNDDNVSLESVTMLVAAGGTLGTGAEETLAFLGKRNPARADAVRRILSGG